MFATADLLAQAHRLAAEGRYDDLAAVVADTTATWAQTWAETYAEPWAEVDGAETLLAEIGSLVPPEEPAWCVIADLEVGRLVEADYLSAAMEKAREIHRHVEARSAAEPDSPRWQEDLAASHTRLGRIAAGSEDPAAVEHLEAGASIRRRLAAADPTDAVQQWNVVVDHGEVAGVATMMGDLITAGRHHRAGLRIIERFATADPSDESWAMALSLAQRDLSVFEEILAESVRIHESAVRTTQRLSAERPETLQFQWDLAASHEVLGDLAVAGDDLRSARHHYDTALDVASRLAAAGSVGEQFGVDVSALRRKVHRAPG